VVKLAPVSADVAAAGHSTARSGRWRSARFPWIASGVVYTVLVVLCALAGYWLMFSQFAVYDDEGFFDYSLQLFVNGHPLYSSVFSPYGPFYYVVFGGFFALVGHDVTTNAGRLIQLTIWVTVSLGIGVTAHRLTGRLTIGVASLATAFLLLAGLTSEPMHAAALACLLLTALVAVAAFVVRSGEQAGLAAVGAICAALLLTKINVGGFAAIAIVFAAVLAGGSLLRVRPLRWLVIAAFVLVGPALMVSKLNAGWARSYAIVAALSTLSLVLVALPTRIELLPRDASLRWLRPLIGGFVAVVLLVLAIVFALGTRPGDLINQIIVVPSRQDDILQVPITLNGNVIWWSLAATVLAWTMREGGLLAREERPARVWDGLLRTAVGVAILLSLAGQSVFSVAPNARFSLAMPLAWVAALPSRRDSGEPLERMVRLLIPALAILEALQAFPVAGTQVDLGSLLLVLCGAVCLADGWAELVACDEERAGRPALARPALAALFAALAVGTFVNHVLQAVETNHNLYRSGQPLHVFGASRLHINPGQATAIDRTVALVRARCKTLASYPGMYSFNIWTGLPTPSPFTGEQPYWRVLSRGEQEDLVRAMKSSRGLCAVRNDTLAASYGGRPMNSAPVIYIDRAFQPIAQFPPYTVLVRRGGEPSG
jgi:hypothetical protein